ncbi:MAG TPA: hypothetical protein VK992_06675, partial [Candidatus Caenarcaniphilales bacterium]|nr:hypothetical protein [Candidatus Caenarcaniphilales bacterium]
MSDLHALLTHARAVPADERAAFGRVAEATLPRGSVMLETCHRVEVYGAAGVELMRRRAPVGSIERHGDEVTRHVVRLAVGRDSAVVAEDQILHQLRGSLNRARAAGAVPVDLDRLF